MRELLAAHNLKAQVLGEWRERERKRVDHMRALERRNRFRPVRAILDYCKSFKRYLDGDFGEPQEADKLDLIMSAVRGDFHGVRKFVLKFGEIEGAVDAQHELDGRTALSIACAEDHVEIVDLLIEAGAIDVPDRFGSTALHHACAMGSFECVTALLEIGIDVDARDRSGITPLMRAAAYSDLVELLLEYGAAPILKDKLEGWTALHYAARKGDPKSILLLLKSGCDFKTLSATGENAHDVALNFKKKKGAILLEKWRRGQLFPEEKIGLSQEAWEGTLLQF